MARTSTSRHSVKAAAIPIARRGSTQSGMRAYNERLVISLIRMRPALPKAEIARMTGLSAQTVSVIVRHLERDGLVRKGTPLRGRVGQPQQPYSLNPKGAYAIGLKVGRRSSDILALDFAGHVIARHSVIYRHPSPSEVLNVAKAGLAKIATELGTAKGKRVTGVGIATPFELWNWEQEVGSPHEILEQWRNFDMQKEIQALTDRPVVVCNDATAACAAELYYGLGRKYRQFAYFYVGFFIGGGIVMNGELYQGPSRNAGAFGPILIPGETGAEQLIRHASIYVLERALEAAGKDPLELTRHPEDWSWAGDTLKQWIESTAKSLAMAAIAATAVVDFEAVVIDGAVPAQVRTAIVEATQRHFLDLDHRGLSPFDIREGKIGVDARAIGGAALSLLSSFGIERDALFSAPR